MRRPGCSRLLLEDPATLANRFFLCSDHFNQRDYSNKNNSFLKRCAIPRYGNSVISDDDMHIYDLKWSCNVSDNNEVNDVDIRELFVSNMNNNVISQKNDDSSDANINVNESNDSIGNDYVDLSLDENDSLNDSNLSLDMNHNDPVIVVDLNININNNSDSGITEDLVVKQRKNCRHCCAVNCSGVQLGTPLFTFPNLKTKTLDLVKIQR